MNHEQQKEHARKQAEGHMYGDHSATMNQEQQKAHAMQESMKNTYCEPNEGLYS